MSITAVRLRKWYGCPNIIHEIIYYRLQHAYVLWMEFVLQELVSSIAVFSMESPHVEALFQKRRNSKKKMIIHWWMKDIFMLGRGILSVHASEESINVVGFLRLKPSWTDNFTRLKERWPFKHGITIYICDMNWKTI